MRKILKFFRYFIEDHCVSTHLITISLANYIQKIYKIQEIYLNHKKIPSNFGEDYFFSISIHKMRKK
jgi:hypothetical protein